MRGVAISHDKLKAELAGANVAVRIFDVFSGRNVGNFCSHSDGVNCVDLALTDRHWYQAAMIRQSEFGICRPGALSI